MADTDAASTAQQSARELWGKTSFPGQAYVRLSILFPSTSRSSSPQQREVTISRQSCLQSNIQASVYQLPTCDPSSARTGVRNHKLLRQEGFEEIIKAPFPTQGWVCDRRWTDRCRLGRGRAASSPADSAELRLSSSYTMPLKDPQRSSATVSPF